MWTPHYILQGFKVFTKFTKWFHFLTFKHRFKMETVFLSESSLCSLFSWKWCFKTRKLISLSLLSLRSHPWVSSMVTAEVSSGLLVPSWEKRKWTGKLLGGQKPTSHVCALHDKWRKERREEQGGHKQKLELCEKWTLFRSLQSHPFTKPGRGTVLSLGVSQAWP